ncbi:MAG TPA: hypothetical protein VFX51_22660 [Solirubrobacteraceae bacterium]|nr:hypothetical protein [Solirubrobacteraceae bacterium]
MSRARKLVEGAFKKLDEASAKADAAAVAKLSPAERERYDSWVERTAALNAGVSEAELGDPRLVGKVLGGPAGEVVHGVVKAPKQRDVLEDPAAWEEQRRSERAARDEVRAPYLAADRRPVRITRVATRGKSQLREIADYLASSGLAGRPELVYGAYRVPDLISPSMLGSERSGIVEWDIVHAAGEALPRAETPPALTLAAKDRLVVRSPGDPAPLDEDLALHLLAGAGIGPDQTLAIARDVAITHRDTGGDDTSSRIEALVNGVHILATRPVPAVGAPVDLPEGPPDGVVVDVLQWDAIAVAVHPVRQHRAPLPSPFPYLPLTPQELLTAYLEIVGVSPSDAYSAQVTHHQPFNLMGRTSAKRGVRRTGGGPDLPSADGKPRKRMAGGHHVVIAYRDAPAYVEGRARFDAYAEGELKAHLRRGLNLRVAVPRPQNTLMRTIDRVGDVVDFFSGDMGVEDGFVPPRYCWPPR